MTKISHYLSIGLLPLLVLTACNKKESATTASAPTQSVEAPATATATAESTNNNVTQNEQLGTKWGDELQSKVTTVDAQRVSDIPLAETQLRYADKNFKGKTLNDISMVAGQVRFSLEDDNGNSLPLFRDKQQYFVKAQAGQSYQLHYKNNSDKTFEVVASVDGLDVLNGSTASRSNTGYVLAPHEDLVIEGFRKSEEAVASFTFSKPEDSYANHNASGSIDNTGIIGTVLYELEDKNKPKPTYAPEPTAKPNAFPADK
ncbi:MULTISPECIES: hypothetical protein [unclassified Moraxella]|uniref:hypothetical protein n=1 Tax=unclassified Moraxella TaxID=2685852 RepID=UPI003AF76315